MSGDYLKLEGDKGWKICPAPGDLTNGIYPRNLTKKFSRGAGFDQFLKICPRVAQGGNDNAWN